MYRAHFLCLSVSVSVLGLLVFVFLPILSVSCSFLLLSFLFFFLPFALLTLFFFLPSLPRSSFLFPFPFVVCLPSLFSFFPFQCRNGGRLPLRPPSRAKAHKVMPQTRSQLKPNPVHTLFGTLSFPSSPKSRFTYAISGLLRWRARQEWCQGRENQTLQEGTDRRVQ